MHLVRIPPQPKSKGACAVIVRVVAEILIRRCPEEVFDFITAPDAVGKSFDGHGPIPGSERSEVLGEESMRNGSIRRVHNTDGTVVDEEILSLE